MTPPAQRNRDFREATLLAIALVVYSNSLALWGQRHGRSPERLFRRFNPLFAALLLIYCARRKGGFDEVGLHRRNAGKAVLAGLGMGAVLSAPPLFFLQKPLLLDTPLEYGPVSGLTRRGILVDVCVRTPINIALLEEVAFRGLLYSTLRRQLYAPTAVALSSVVFAAWHISVTAASVTQTNLSAAQLPRFLLPYIQPLAVAGGMITTGVAGAAFAFLHERTGNLAAPLIAHWVVDGVMLTTIWLKRAPTRTELPLRPNML